MNRYFAVKTKCGHVGKDKCIFIWFAVKAENGKSAAAKARNYSRVKHHHKYAIREVRKISFEEYTHLRFENANDNYLQCKNIQQQRKLENFSERVEEDMDMLLKRNKIGRNRDSKHFLKKNKILMMDAIRQIKDSFYSVEIAG